MVICHRCKNLRPFKSKSKEISVSEPQEDNELIDRILKWVREWQTATGQTIIKSEDKIKNLLSRLLKSLGRKRLEELFGKEANIYSPNAIKFLFETLPAELKNSKER